MLDAGNAFSLAREEDDEGNLRGWKAFVSKENGLKVDNPAKLVSYLHGVLLILL